MEYRSASIMQGAEYANVRALYRSSGFSDEEMKKPIIGIVNSFNEICPGHANLRILTERVKQGIYANGGTPMEFGTVGACDGISMGHSGMRYVLPTREMIANDIEAMVEAHKLDGIVLIGSCDKIVPGMLMGAVRLNLPAIFLNGGPTLPGRMTENNPYGGQYIDHSIIQQSEGALKQGLISEEMFNWVENNAVPTIGSCAMLGTANTMCCLAESMGMSLPNSATIPAVYSRRYAVAFETGKAIMELVFKNICPRDIVTKEALTNSIRVNSAIGGSTNAVLHILAIAYEAEISLDIFEFGEISISVPHLVPMIPAGDCTLLDFYEAGGVQAIMKSIRSCLDKQDITCNTKSLDENLSICEIRNKNVIREMDNPVHQCGGIAILKGNIAPAGAVAKPSAVPSSAHHFVGSAHIYESEEDALLGIRNGEVVSGEVVVIRNEGPKGGPGMPEMYKAMKLLVGMNLGDKVCLITDGRFSGSNNGCFVGHICPEAADDGPIAYLKNGDMIEVDLNARTIEALNVDFEQRKKETSYEYNRNVKGYLHHYKRTVSSSSNGAIIPNRD
ncbi:dihydroxy-acid dehydratase [Candidatus Epulonipiscium fishelsonii]|uniref:Dihydroxy-acid dehydratase n=1 Tax=Candidatus Epulonipiscium fishelsonii TaxID=77094 RepID=A0ACC8XD16_9FIRM|nr:dihydroxy-acid dehydratase [Epulopiscium sp. SCG-B05WGA-EpuloA1]ONI40785.1 dihydroxy-acid dehydratase [Epulopiscium sp. SCG-B11WGA-EpuloA1]